MTLPQLLQRFVIAAPEPQEQPRALSLIAAAELLGVTPSTLDEWIAGRMLIAWPAAGRGMRVPPEQITGAGERVPGIARVLAVICDSAAAWDFLVADSPFLHPCASRRPIDALKAGEVGAVVAAAHSFLDCYT